MKILIAVHGFPPREPGVWTIHHARELARRHSVWVYARTNHPSRPEFDQWEDRDGAVTVRRVVHQQLDPMRYFNGFQVPQIDERFLAFVDEIGPDVIHFEHLFGLSAGIVAGARARGVPTVLCLYDAWMICQRVFLLRADGTPCAGPDPAFDCVTCIEGQWRRFPPDDGEMRLRLQLHDFRQATLRQAFEAASVVTTCSQALRESFAATWGLSQDRLRVVSLGVPPLAAPVIHVPSARVRIVYLGALAPHKGVHLLAEAAQALDDLEVEVRVHGAGAPSFLDRLRELYPRLSCRPPYARDELPGILAHTDILVLPSLAAETFSFVLREAALANVPVVASRIGAIPEYIRDGETGLLFEPGNVADLARALRRLVLDPRLRARLANAHGPVRSVEDYSGEMEQIYRSLANEAAPSAGEIR
ncbi:MAG: glycosyltransferase [Acidobacteriota bacterium]